MRETGELIDWNDDRGFGFIARPGSAEKLFVHIRALRQAGVRPLPGDRLTYGIGPGRDGRPAAIDVVIAGASGRAPQPAPRPAPDQLRARRSPRFVVAALLAVLVIAGCSAGRLPLWIGGLYALAGLAALGLYGVDKNAAERGAWRIPERSLHGLDLVFGIIGGLLAQELFRHKTSKPAFATVSFAIAGLHGVVLVLIAAGTVAPETIVQMLQELMGS